MLPNENTRSNSGIWGRVIDILGAETSIGTSQLELPYEPTLLEYLGISPPLPPRNDENDWRHRRWDSFETGTWLLIGVWGLLIFRLYKKIQDGKR